MLNFLLRESVKEDSRKIKKGRMKFSTSVLSTSTTAAYFSGGKKRECWISSVFLATRLRIWGFKWHCDCAKIFNRSL